MGFFTDLAKAASANMGLQIDAYRNPYAVDHSDSAALSKSAAWPILASLVPRLERMPADVDMYSQALVYATVVWQYTCSWIISSSYGSLPVQLYTGRGDKKEKLPQDHPAWALIDKPNPMESGAELREAHMLYTELTGNGYQEKVFGMDGKPMKLFNLEPFYMSIVPDPVEKVRAYVYDRGGAQKVTFQRESISHLKWVNPLNQFYGMSTITALQTTLITEIYREAYNKSFLENEARPDLILRQTPDVDNNVFPINMGIGGDRTPLVRLAREWRASFSGPRKARLPVMLPPGIDVSVLSEARQDMDFREMEKSLRERVLSGNGVPPCLAGLYEYANYANVKEQIKIFWTVTMPPKVNTADSTFSRDVLEPYWPGVYMEHDMTNIPALEEDSKERTEKVNSMFDRGALKRKEYRELLGLPADPDDPYGDTYFVNSSYVTVEDIASAPAAEPPADAGAMDNPGGDISSPNFSVGNNGGQLNG